jgi:hypothetical protein
MCGGSQRSGQGSEKIPKECKLWDRGRPTTIDLAKGEISKFGEWNDQWLGSLHFKLPVTKIPLQLGPLDRGRLIAIDLIYGSDFGFRGLRSQKTQPSCIVESKNVKSVSWLGRRSYLVIMWR